MAESLMEAFQENPVTESSLPEEGPVIQEPADDVPVAGEPEAPPEAPEAPPEEKTEEKPVEKQKFTFTRNGEEITEELTPDEIHMRIARYRNAEAKAQELAVAEKKLAEIKEKVEEQYGLVQKAKDDPIAFFKGLGVDFDGIAKQRVLEQYELEQMTPEQREAYQAKQKLAEYQRREEERKTADAKAAEDAKVAQERAVYEQRTVSLIESGKLPKNRNTALRIIDEFKDDFYNGQTRSDEAIVEAVKTNYGKELNAYLEALEPEPLLESLGKDLVAKVVKAYSAKKPERSKPIVGEPTQKKAKARKIYNSLDEFDEDE